MSEQDETREPAVRITLTQVYQKLVEIETRLGDHPKMLDDHEVRIRNLEMKVWGFAGIGSAVAIIVSAIITKMP
jgi:hypothetical protein